MTSLQTNQNFTVKSFINCSCTHLVYVISCNECRVQYVGCTIRSLRIQINEHIYDIKRALSITRRISNASKHFIEMHQGDFSTLSVMGIEKVVKPRTVWNWVSILDFKIKTCFPLGLNYQTDLMYFYWSYI